MPGPGRGGGRAMTGLHVVARNDAPQLAPGEHPGFPASRALRALDALGKSFRTEELDEAARAGKRVVWGLAPGWGPLLRACDTSTFMIRRWIRETHRAASVAEDYFHVPPETCTVMKVGLGAHRLRALRPDGEPIKRILHFGGDCEPEVMAQELMRREGYDVHIIEPLTAWKLDPARRREYVRFYAEEARKAAVWLTGKAPDEDRLRVEIAEKNQVTRKILELLALRRKNPLYIPIVRLNQLLLGAHTYYAPVDPAKNRAAFFKVLDDLIAELKEVARLPVAFHVPLALVGTMYSLDLYRAIDHTCGAVVAGMEPSLYREDVPPLEALGEYLLDMQLRGDMHDKSGSVASYRRYRVEREIEESGARGLIVGGTTNCPYLAVARELEYEYFSKKGIPVLVLDGSAHDEPATEEQKMRLRAFIEMLVCS